VKVLNLYAGIGGNRKLWTDVEVTAVELDKQIADIYKSFFPQDNVIVADAHQYLLEHYREFDFIWASPPCPTHSNVNHFLNAQGVIRYPDMSLYQEIIFLKYFFKGKYVVENVKPYYELLVNGFECGRHIFWSNFFIQYKEFKSEFSITNCKGENRMSHKERMKKLQELHGFDLSKYELKFKHPEKLLTNCVQPELGLHVLEQSKIDRQLSFA